MKRILVATDGSEKSKEALQKARKLGTPFKSDLTIITVINTLGSPYLTDPEIKMKVSRENIRYGESILKGALKIFEDYPGNVNAILRDGDIAEKIIEEAEEREYDLVIIGSRGLGTFSRALLGSVSSRVVNHIKKSILIVK